MRDVANAPWFCLYQIGEAVFHNRYGRGVVARIETENSYYVRFDSGVEAKCHEGSLTRASASALPAPEAPLSCALPRADLPASRFYSAARLKEKAVPPREWLVERLIPANTVTLFSGDGGVGKSLLALQLAVAATVGCAWLNLPVKSGRAIYLSAEDDDDELHRRIDSILCHYGKSYDDIAGLTLRSLAGEDASLRSSTLQKRICRGQLGPVT